MSAPELSFTDEPIASPSLEVLRQLTVEQEIERIRRAAVDGRVGPEDVPDLSFPRSLGTITLTAAIAATRVIAAGGEAVTSYCDLNDRGEPSRIRRRYPLKPILVVAKSN